ncbi:MULTISPECIES: Fe2+-dependent dioxygenase [unclassified Halomonas]|uniref:Fe2+-dependent dioxygenase n=1 Tax=unclassified Halomonas TaxID=2609666 RepID=UPI0007D9695D|nr:MULTISPECIES: Fe2+-dependent dioxygenase [unclassified Halomonas]MBT2785061.1 Fe2+-dependent dioxygenase [Halomonas sp. ISL-106]MBT2796755.1 Fe2+-dependent dioxygenase [Halomonas sp. ISL-104]OAL59985.1 Fe2+-dependent dioxygenase [Halomonas sp. ALS9]
MIVSFENILTPEELAAVRRQLHSAEWARGISAGPQAKQVKKNLQMPEGSEVLRELRVLVMRALNRTPELMSAVMPFKIIPPNFNRYTVEDSHYGKHIDSTLRSLPDGSYLRTDVSATLFLSEPDEYEGGELKIIDTFGEQTVKLPAGSLVAYPSGSLHEVTPVTKGERLGCYMFMQSLIRDTEQRRLLYEMDTSLRKLRAQYGEQSTELVQLTGTYNNLVRMWSEC